MEPYFEIFEIDHHSMLGSLALGKIISTLGEVNWRGDGRGREGTCDCQIIDWDNLLGSSRRWFGFGSLG
jgi:hypothetical protein